MATAPPGSSCNHHGSKARLQTLILGATQSGPDCELQPWSQRVGSDRELYLLLHMNRSGGSLDQPLGMWLALWAREAQRRRTVRFRGQSGSPLGYGHSASRLPKRDFRGGG
jgi:hypothetical protein